jgi:hypothetical protein
MKKIKILSLLILCLSFKGYTQVISVKTSIVNEGGDVVEVFGDPSANLTAVTFNEIDLVIGLANAGVANPVASSIVATSLVSNLSNPIIDASFGDSSVQGGRVYYLFKLFDAGGAEPTSTWTTATSNPIASFQFPVDPTTLTMRLEDLTTGGSAYTGGGTNGNLFQYIDLNSGVISNGAGTAGDITAFNPMFYGTGASNNNPTAASFVPLQVADPLPVKFITFTATLQNDDALLSWTVSNEGTGAKDYEVQKSIDNGASYTTIDTVAITNPNASSNTYSYTDANLSSVKSTSNVIYYRIKQDDTNGQSTYSSTQIIQLPSKVDPTVTVYPNPVQDVATVKFYLAEDAPVTINLTGINGQVLQTTQLQGAIGENIPTVNMSSLVNGNYVLSVNIDGVAHTFPLVKSN